MSRDRLSTLAVLIVVAAGALLAECAFFHFPFAVGWDVLWLTGLTLLPGTLVVLLLRYFFAIEIEAHEILSLGAAVGFGLPALLLWIFRDLGIQHPDAIYYIIRVGITVTVLVLLLLRKLRLGFKGQLRAINDLFVLTIAALIFFAIYNLVQFHYGGDGSIVTRGLFGVDLPFLAGEIHGIQVFGSLRDLHQLAQPWHYHDWTYKLLALLPPERTLPDLAFAAPLVGYVLLAFSVFAYVQRITKSSYIAYISSALWFLVSGLGSGELGSYALSPSFVFGSIIILNVLLVLDLWRTARARNAQWVFFAILFYFLIELSQTKLSSYLVLVGALGIIGVIGLISRNKNFKLSIELLIALLVSLGIVLWQNSGANPLMPSGDFLIGAPLLGYANHVARALHVPVSTINPVSHGFHLRWQSLLIIPFFIFHIARFIFTDVKLLTSVLLLLFFWRQLWNEMGGHTALFVIVILLGFFLPVLYSPAWYPLALSFYAPLMSVQGAFLLVTMAFGIFAKRERTRSRTTAIGIVGLLFVFGIAQEFHFIRSQDENKPHVVSASLVDAMNYVAMHSNDSSVLATRRFDLDSSGDESYYWYSALSGRAVVSEGANYGSLLAAEAVTDSEKGLHPVPAARNILLDRRAMLDTIFLSHDSSQVSSAVARSGTNILLEDRSEPLGSRPAIRGTILFANKEDTIWKLR